MNSDKQFNMTSETSSGCWASTLLLCGLDFASKMNIFSAEKKTIPPFCMPDFGKFQRRPDLSALFRCWRTVICWHFIGFTGESLRSFFTVILIDFGSFKIKSHFSHGAFGVPPYSLSNSLYVAFRTTWARVSAFGTIFSGAKLFVPAHHIINCGFWCF